MKRFSLALALLLTASAALRADFTFIHATDLHVGSGHNPSNVEKDAELFREISALEPRPAFIMGTGDLCELGTESQYVEYRRILSNLSVPSYQAPGNHDVRWNPLGKEGFVKGSGQPMYQSWSYRGIHFILLDSTTLLQHWGHFDADMLAWLGQDLSQWGTEKPVIIGFHHWIGRESAQVDNEQELMDLVAPYNVRLWLQGHGHSNIEWNVNGTPAIMAQGLYQGAYHIIEVKGDTLHLIRRHLDAKPKKKAGNKDDKKDDGELLAATTQAATKVSVVHQDLMTVPLSKPQAPNWDARLEPNGVIRVDPGDLPAGSEVAIRVNQGKYEPMKLEGDGWIAHPSPALPGEHVITVQASLKDGRCYQKPLHMSIHKSGTPQPAWEKNIGAAVMSRLVRDGDTLYVPSMGGDLVAMDAASGTEKWRLHTGGSIFSTPQIEQGTIYFGSADHFIYAADAESGRVKWKHQTGGAVFGGAAVAKDVVAIASCDRRIYGLDAASGQVKWTVKTGGMTQSKLATDGNLFFAGTWDNTFRAINAAAGNEVWSHKFGKSKSGAFSFYFAPAIGAPAVGDGKVFISSNDGLLHAVDIASGKIAWETPKSHQLGYNGPLYRDGKVYQGSLPGTVYCFDAATGKILWQRDTGPAIYDSSCAYADGNIYIGCVDGTFSALSIADGKVDWQYRLGAGHVLASPATDDRRVYIGSMSGKITAFPLR